MKKLIILMAVLGLFIVGLVSAFTATINTPSTGGTITAASKLNVSVGEWGDNASIRCALMASSPSTANSSTSLIFNTTNATTVTDSVNVTFSANIVLEDSNDYTFTATCYNGTDSTATDSADAASVTSVIVSRTTPTAPTTTHTTDTVFDDVTTKTLTYTVVDATTTGCRIAFLDDGAGPRFTGTNTFAMTYSGTSCTYVVTKAAIPDMTYNVYVQASDGVDTAVSAKGVFRIETMAGGGTDDDVNWSVGLEYMSKSTKQLLLFILILGGGYFLFFNKKKK